MRFRAVHKLMSYLLAAAAVTTLITSGAMPLPTLGLLLLVGTLSWFVEPGTWMGQLLDRAGLVFNVVALAFFGLSLFQVIQSFPEPDLTPVLNLVLFLLGYKLFQRRNNRDYLQLYILSFLLVMAAAWLAQSVLFVFGFAAYVVLATWTLILFHLRREIEDNYLVKHLPETGAEKVTAARVLNSRRVVGRAFFLSTGMIAIGVFVGAAAVFAVIPRIGVGFLAGGFRRRVNIVGFSDTVTLGHHGVISGDNQTVVLWVKMPRLAAMPDWKTRDAAISQLYWRGTVYDTYQIVPVSGGLMEGTWGRSKREGTRTQLQPDPTAEGDTVWWLSSAEAPANKRRPSQKALRQLDEQEIQVVGLAHPVAFALDEPIAYRTLPTAMGSFIDTQLARGFGGEVALDLRRRDRRDGGAQGVPLKEFTGARYFAYSRNPMLRPLVGQGEAQEELEREGRLQNYLEVPAQLSPRVRELARTLTHDKPTPMAKVQAIVEWLRKTHGYTTDLRRNPQIADWLEDFLFHQTAGHCEYFATASAILIRLAGVPTRYINGFLGGEWNEFGETLTVRDNRAHSWVEAYLGPAGWVRVDATPAAGAATHMSRLLQVFDSVEFFWSRWVIDYDASRQIELANRIGRRIGIGKDSVSFTAWRRPAVRWTAAGVALVLLAVVIGRRVHLRKGIGPGRTETRGPRGGPAIVRLWETTLARLARDGWVRAPAETPREFIRRLAEAQVTGTDSLQRLAELYAAARFGAREIPETVVRELEREVALAGGAPPPPSNAAPPAAA